MGTLGRPYRIGSRRFDRSLDGPAGNETRRRQLSDSRVPSLGSGASFNFAGLLAGFQAAAFEGGWNEERYRWYIPTLPYSSGIVPEAELAEWHAGGRRVVRTFMEPFDTNNDPEISKTVAQITTGDTLAVDEISIGDMGANWGAATVGMEVCLKWAGPDTYNVGGIVVQRQGHYQISSVNGTFVRLRIPGQVRNVAGSLSQALTNGAVLALEWRPFNSRIANWRTSIQRAIDAGFWVVATAWGGNLWDRATTQANLAPRNDFGWPAIDKLHRSWCTWMAANVTDAANRLVLQWQNEDVADSSDPATAEALSKPHRERMLLAMREAAPTKLIMAGGARWSSIASLVQIVPQDIPGLIYTFHDYSDGDPATVFAPVVAWRAANGNRFAWPGEIDRLTYSDANGTQRRDSLRARRTWLRANLGTDGTWWGLRYPPHDNNAATRELGTTTSNVTTLYSAMREFMDERPVNQAVPTISGTAQEGQTLTAAVGTWTGRATLSYAFQWQRGTTDIAGATASTYVAQAADVGQTLRCRVTATNGLGSAQAFSANTAAVTGATGTQFTSMAWNLRLGLAVLAGGAGGGNINYNTGRHDHRADFDSQITTANADVSAWASGQSFSGTLDQSVSANRPTHSSANDIVQFTGSTATNDTTNGKWFVLSSGIVSRYAATPNAIGVAYFLVRFPTLPTWTHWLLRIGTNSNFYTNRDRLAYNFGVTASQMVAFRGSNTSAVSAAIASRPAANEWVALAVVLNDDRTTPGVSDQITRLFAKTKPGGTYATMASASSTALSTAGAAWNNGGGSAEGRINQLRFNASATTEGIGNFDLHSFGFDDAPPTTNAGIESVLDTLLGRV